jgi:hypothetical protein
LIQNDEQIFLQLEQSLFADEVMRADIHIVIYSKVKIEQNCEIGVELDDEQHIQSTDRIQSQQILD